MSSISVLIVLLVVVFAAAFPARDEIFFRDDDDDDFDGEILKIENDNELLPTKQAKSIGSETEFVNPTLMNGEYFQGDIKLVQDQMNTLLSNSSLPTRTGVIDEFYRWPKTDLGFVLVPYYLHKESEFTSNQVELIRAAMADIQFYTCARFIPWTTEEDFVLIHAGKGCSSNLGKIGGQQDISLSKRGCFLRGIVMHELIHALGYDHMHNHADRDKFIDIKWNNIVQHQRHNFEKVNPRLFSNFGTDYDLHSIMHYDKKAFSLNGRSTMLPIDQRYMEIIGQRHSLSRGDAARINNMYKCTE